MALPVWVDNLIAYSLQIAILVSAGTLLAYLFRLRMPRVSLIYWQVLLLVCLLLPAFQSWKHPVQFQTIATSGTVVYEIPQEVVAVKAKPPFSVTPEIVGLMIGAGACLRMIWLLLGYFRLRRLLRHSRFFSATAPVSECLSVRIGVQACFFLSNEIDSPATFGLFTPTVILPGSFPAMSETCREAIVCHELLHVRRCDWVLILVEEIVRSIYWFHPAVWWLLGRIHLAREQSVDHQVVQLTGSRQPYLDSLLEIARSRGRPKAVPAPLFSKERHLVQRVALLLKEVSMNPLRLAVSLAGIAALLAGTVRLAAGWFPLTGEPKPAQQQPATREYSQPARDSTRVTGPALPTSEPGSRIEVAANTNTAVLPSPSPAKAETQVSGQETTANSQVAPPQRAPIKVGDSVQESKLIHRVEPIYPEQALAARLSGRVVLQVTVNEEGFVSDVQVMSGHPLLTEPAITAVKQWQYSPTFLNGAPVPVIASVTVVFAIKGDRGETGSGLNAPAMLPLPAMGASLILMAGVDGYIGFRASPIDEKGPPAPNTESFHLPQLTTTPEPLNQWQKMAVAGWPTDVAKGTLAYSFVVTEAGELKSFTRVQGPEIPDLERELSQMRIVSPGLRGSTAVSSWCILEFGRKIPSGEMLNLIRSSTKP